jgi:serine/threonine-protein kinase
MGCHILFVGRDESHYVALAPLLRALGAQEVSQLAEPLQALPRVKARSVDAILVTAGVRGLSLRKLLENPQLREAGIRVFLLAHDPDEPLPPEATLLDASAAPQQLAETVWSALGRALPPPERFEVRVPLLRTEVWDSGRAWDSERQRDVLVACQPTGPTGDTPLLLEEARGALGVAHRNLPRVLEVGETHGRAFVAWEDVDGQWLPWVLHRTREEGPLELASCVWIVAELAEALAAAHAGGITHGLLDADSVWLTPGGDVRLLYLGLSRFALGARLSTRKSMSPELPAFGDLAPEMLGTERRLAAPGDVYRLGLLLYRLLWSTLPFAAARQQGGAMAELEAVRRQTPTPPTGARPDVPEALTALVLRMLEKQPELRPDVATVVASLGALVLPSAGVLSQWGARLGLKTARLRPAAPPAELVRRLTTPGRSRAPAE